MAKSNKQNISEFRVKVEVNSIG